MNSDDDNKPRGILFLLADGTPWAEMRCLGWDDEPEGDNLSDAFANIIIPPNPRLH